MKSKFSKGPWKCKYRMLLNGCGSYVPFFSVMTDRGTGSRSIVDVRASETKAEFNARLISVSPELFENLSECITELRLVYKIKPLPHLKLLIDKALATISKAGAEQI